MENNQGKVETPNWPGEYPIDVTCTWNISPPKGRRVLIVIPEIDLDANGRCGDKLSMRKSGKLNYSVYFLNHTLKEHSRPPFGFVCSII